MIVCQDNLETYLRISELSDLSETPTDQAIGKSVSRITIINTAAYRVSRVILLISSLLAIPWYPSDLINELWFEFLFPKKEKLNAYYKESNKKQYSDDGV